MDGSETTTGEDTSLQDWTELKEILADALECENTDQRNAFLQRACDGNPARLREVERLLGQRTDMFDTFADHPALKLREQKDEFIRQQLGAYRVVREVGRGGMGTVYLAERADGRFARTVAIKILKNGTNTDEVLRRFRIEREILARLEHPNITRLLDAGTTADGSPYFVMEFVEGAPITAFADQHHLSSEQRVILFLNVCAAVDFAHRQGIIHRDIKPSNVLVGSDHEPKLLDFGIARAVRTSEREATVTVPLHQRLTPKYASPEQRAGQPVQESSDIYSLGAVLLELLTAQNCPGSAVKGTGGPPSEFGRIISRAMAADPRYRYSTAADLAQELAACLKPGNNWRRLRNGLLLSAAAVVAIGFLFLSSFKLHRKAIVKSETPGGISENGVSSLSNDPKSTAPAKLAKRGTVSADAYEDYTMARYFWSRRSRSDLDRAIEYLGRSIKNDPNFAPAFALEADCYYLKAFLKYGPEVESMQKSREAAERAIALDPSTAEARVSMAAIQFWQGKPNKGMLSLRQAITLDPNLALGYQRYAWALCTPETLNESLIAMKRAVELDPLSATNNAALGALYIFARDYSSALRACSRALELEPRDSVALPNLGWVNHVLGRYDEAIAVYDKLGQLDAARKGDATALRAAVLYSAGRKSEAESLMPIIAKLTDDDKIAPYNLTLLYTTRGEIDKAFEAIREKGLAVESDPMLQLDPLLDSLRKDPRFSQATSRSRIFASSRKKE